MANYYIINRAIEAYEFRTIDPDDGLLKNILDITGSGGGGGGDLTSYYNKTETDNLLNDKLNINNPQDISGTLRLGHIDGLSKIILNGVASDKDFYVNGDAQVLGNHLVASLDSTGYIKGTSLISNFVNADNTNDIFFQSNSVPYAQFDFADDLFRFIKNVDVGNIACNGNLNTNLINTVGNSNLRLNRNGATIILLETDDIVYMNNEYETDIDNSLTVRNIYKGNTFDSYDNLNDIKFRHNNVNDLSFDYDYETNGGLILGNLPLVLGTKLDIPRNTQLHFQQTDSYINETLDNGNFLNFVMREQTGQMDFYVGDPTVGTNKVMTLQNDLITFHKPTTPEIGATVDDSNYVKKQGETAQLILGQVEFQGLTTQAYKFSMGGPSVFAQYRRFEIYNSEIISYRVMKFTNALGLQSNLVNSYTDTDLVVQRNSNNILQFNTSNQLQFLQGAQKSFIYEEEFVDVGTINAFRIRNTENSNTAYVSFGVGDVLDVLQIYRTGITSAVEMTIPNVLCNAFDSFGNNDVVFSRNGVEYMKFEGTLSSVELAQGVKSNIYNSIGNADVSFRRNTIDFFYLRNNQVETNSGTE